MARLLLVDDEPGQLKVWQGLMETWGHVIETAETLPRAIEQLELAEPDVLIMDLRLPELKDGLALIRHACQFSSSKVIVLSGWPMDLDFLPEREMVHRVLAKPVRPRTLLRVITELTARSAAG